MSVLTIEKITNYFLYGEEEKPLDLTDVNLIGRLENEGAVIEVDPNDYMSEVWINSDLSKSILAPSKFNVIEQFLNTTSGGFQNGMSYNLNTALSMLGLSNEDRDVRLQLVDYFDGSKEMADQIYIWNSADFTLHNSIIFRVDSNGVRTIENYAPIPLADNFNFVTASSLLDIANLGNQLVLRDQIDPFRIGRTVTINFESVQPDYFRNLSINDLNVGVSPINHYTGLLQFADAALRSIVPDLTRSISNPSVQVVEGRKVIYGTPANDSLEPKTRSIPLGPDAYRNYYNGFYFLGGAGADEIAGSEGDDYFDGGSENDTYFFDTSSNIGNDFIDDESGNNHIVLDGQSSDRYINGMTITEVDPGTGFYYELDTNGDIVEGLKFVLSAQDGGGSQLAIQLSPSLLSGSGSITIQNFNAANYGLTLVGGSTDDFGPDAPTVTSGADVIGNGIINSTQIKPRFLSNLNSQARIYDASQYDWNFNAYGGINYSNATKDFGGSNFNDQLVGSYFNGAPVGFLAEELYGFDGDDIISGEQIGASVGDDDLIVGGRGNDYLYGGPGNDVIFGNNDSNADNGPVVFNHNQYFKDVTLIDGTSTENAGDVDFIDGGIGNDNIVAGSGDDFLVGGQGDDRIYGFAGSDIIRGGSGIDFIWGDAYGMSNVASNLIFAEVDYDSTAFTDYDDIIYGGGGDDYIIGEYGDDVIDGGEGNDYIVGDSNIEVEAFRQIPVELHGNDILNGGAGDDTVFGGGGNDILEGGTGEDYLAGYEGNDTLYGNDDADVIFGDAYAGVEDGGDDVIYGGSGDDALYGDGTEVLNGGNDIIYGGGGADTIRGFGGADTLYGGSGNDLIFADVTPSATPTLDGTTDYLYGEDGDDQLSGSDGDDVLVGGVGSDLLIGYSGWDTYIFDQGDAQPNSSNLVDVLNDSDIELIQINAPVLSTIYNQNLNRIQIAYGSSSAPDYLLVSLDGFLSARNRVYDGIDIEFSGTTNGYQRDLVGNSDDNFLSSNSVSISFLYSHSVYLNDGDDWFSAEQDSGDFYMVWGGEGEDVLDLQGSNSINFNGGEGADTIMFGEGSTQVSINLANSTDNLDRLLLKDGITLNDIDLDKVNDNLVLSISSSPSDELTLTGYFSSNSDQLSLIEFSDGMKFTKHSMENFLDTNNYLIGDSGANTLETPNSGGVLKGMGGDDTLIVDFINPYTPNPDAIGDDVFYGGDGNDYFFSHYGNDTLFGEAGSDTINAGYGDDYLSGGDGNDYLYGFEGNDTLSGGAGDDTMLGGDGYDTYLWGEGFGNDQIFNWSYVPHEQSDELLIVGELTASDIDWSRNGSNLVGEIIDTQETITINGWFDGFATRLSVVKFESGGSIDGFALDMSLRFNVLEATLNGGSLVGTSGEDLIFGSEGQDALAGAGDDDLIYGGDGDDYLFGAEGDDILLGGDGFEWTIAGANGSDFLDPGSYTGTNSSYQVLTGGYGSDLYSFGSNCGNVILSAGEYDSYYTEDSIQFTAASPEDLWFSQDGENLIIDIIGTDNQIVVASWFFDDQYEVTAIYTDGFAAANDTVNGIDALISAMASYDVPSGAGNVVPQAVKDALAPTMANVWQETDRRMVNYY